MYECHPVSASPWSPEATCFLFHLSVLFLFLEISHESDHVGYHLLLFSKSFNQLTGLWAGLGQSFISHLLFSYCCVVLHGMYGWARFLNFSINDMMVVVSIVSLNISSRFGLSWSFHFSGINHLEYGCWVTWLRMLYVRRSGWSLPQPPFYNSISCMYAVQAICQFWQHLVLSTFFILFLVRL